MGPYFNRPCIISVNKEVLDSISKKEATHQVLAEVILWGIWNLVYQLVGELQKYWSTKRANQSQE